MGRTRTTERQWQNEIRRILWLKESSDIKAFLLSQIASSFGGRKRYVMAGWLWWKNHFIFLIILSSSSFVYCLLMFVLFNMRKVFTTPLLYCCLTRQSSSVKAKGVMLGHLQRRWRHETCFPTLSSFTRLIIMQMAVDRLTIRECCDEITLSLGRLESSLCRCSNFIPEDNLQGKRWMFRSGKCFPNDCPWWWWKTIQ